jgi:hypothetical protein
MADSVCNTRELEGIIRGSSATISTTDTDFKGIIQGYEIQFQVPRKQVYDLISPGFYYIEYPPQGVASFSKVVGPKGFQKSICTCTPKTITIDATGPVCYPTGTVTPDATFVLLNALPQQLHIRSTTEDWLVTFTVTYIFSDLQ